MSDHVEGKVAKITEKPTRNGGTIYNVCLEVDGGDDEWFGHGFDEPAFREGDEIGFDIEYNGDYANVDTNTVEILSEGDSKPKSRGRSNGRSGSSNSRSSSRGGSRDAKRSSSSSRSKPAAKSRAKPAAKSDGLSKDEWADKDRMIRRQACMNTSIALVRGALECGAIALPAKKGDKFDAYVELCNEEADRLYDQYEEQVYPKPKSSSRRGARDTRDEEYDDDIPE